MKHCLKCNIERPLELFETRRNPYGVVYRRNVCKVCRRVQKKRPPGTPRKRTGIRHFRNPLPVTYRKGTRCWCCRRNSKGAMLCRTCSKSGRAANLLP